MAFHIPVHPEQVADVNFALNGYDLVVLDEASLISHCTFSLVASTLNSRPWMAKCLTPSPF